MWGLRDFAVLGAWRVQALELQVRLQHPGHAATCVALHRQPAHPSACRKVCGNCCWVLAPRGPWEDLLLFGQKVVLVLCHGAVRQEVSRDVWLECHRAHSVTRIRCCELG